MRKKNMNKIKWAVKLSHWLTKPLSLGIIK